jgi:hypothetical protein
MGPVENWAAWLRLLHRHAPRAEEPFSDAADFHFRLAQHLDKIEKREQRRGLLRGLAKAALYLKLKGDEQDS